MSAKRKRGVPVQVMLTARERSDLARIARKRGKTIAELVRGWARRAAAAERARAPRPMYVDPRQLDMVSDL